jgi:hypothetical protein
MSIHGLVLDGWDDLSAGHPRQATCGDGGTVPALATSVLFGDIPAQVSKAHGDLLQQECKSPPSGRYAANRLKSAARGRVVALRDYTATTGHESPR